MDTVDRQTRSKIMASVGQQNTGAELVLRSFRVVIFVHGCYWHSHGCYKSTVPKSRRAFWTDKFSANRERDQQNIRLLMERGWRAMVVWECELLGKNAFPSHEIAKRVREWLPKPKPLPRGVDRHDLNGPSDTYRLILPGRR